MPYMDPMGMFHTYASNQESPIASTTTDRLRKAKWHHRQLHHPTNPKGSPNIPGTQIKLNKKKYSFTPFWIGMPCHCHVSSAWFCLTKPPKKQAPVSLHWPQSSLPRSRKKTTSTNLHQQRPIGFLEFISPVDSLEDWKRILSEFWGIDDLMSFQVGKNSWGGHVFWVGRQRESWYRRLKYHWWYRSILLLMGMMQPNQRNVAVNFPNCRLINQPTMCLEWPNWTPKTLRLQKSHISQA